MSEKLDKQIEKKEAELKELRQKKLEEQNKKKWLELPEKGIAILTELQYKGKTYPEILKEVSEDQIADYPLLQELRNEGKKSGWKKYAFLRDAWAFVPNPDLVSKEAGRVARFIVYSGNAVLSWSRDSGDSSSTLGVRFARKISKSDKKSTSKKS